MSDLQHSLIPTRPARRLAVVQAEIDHARRELEETWESASSADRIFSVDRLLREDAIAAGPAELLGEVQARVRDTWVGARVATLAGVESTEARLAGLRLTLVERELDTLLAEHGLLDALLLAAEGFLRRVPAPHGRSFRELMRERERLLPILPPMDEAA